MDWWTSLAASIALLWIFCFIDGKREKCVWWRSGSFSGSLWAEGFDLTAKTEANRRNAAISQSVCLCLPV